MIVGQSHAGYIGAVVHLVSCRCRYRQRSSRDIGGRRCCGVLQAVVPSVRARNRDPGNRNCLSIPNSFGCENGAADSVGHRIAAESIVREVHCRGYRGVIDFVDTRCSYCERGGSNVRRRSSCSVGNVVSGIGTRDQNSSYGYSFAVTRTLGREVSGSKAFRH